MADCIEYDTGLWVRQNSDVFLKTCDENGDCYLSYEKATPASMQVLIDELEEFTYGAAMILSTVPVSLFNDEHTKIWRELQEWREELAVYRSYVEQALERGDGPGAIYHCVTAPLLVGWYPNDDCTGPDPHQLTQTTPAIATPMTIMNATLCLDEADLHAGDEVAKYFYALAEGLGTVAQAMADAAEAAANATVSLAKSVSRSPGTFIAAGLGLAALVFWLRR